MSNQIRIQVQGLSCAACAGRAEQALLAVEGVQSATVNVADHSALIALDGANATAIHDALDAAGYPAQTETTELSLDGMTCAGCAARVERTLSDLPGITRAQVNFADRSARLTGLSGATSPQAAIAAVRAAGYDAAPRQSAHAPDAPHQAQNDPAAREIAENRRRALVAGALTLPVFVLEMGGHLVPGFHHWIAQTLGQTQSWLLQFVLITLVLIGPGRPFLQRGVPDLLRGHPDMNSLVAIGTLAAWTYSTVALFAPGLLPQTAQAVYFEAAGVIITLILLGRWLEARARGQAGTAIRALIGLQPRTARVESPDGTLTDTDLSQIAVGDLLHLRPGERVAVDGTLHDGTTHLDESMLTGEPMPVPKAPGDTVSAGTVNGPGSVRYVAQRVGSETTLAQIIDMVRQAQGGRLPIQSLADHVVSRFVPAVLVIAALTVLGWLLLGPDPALSNALVAGVSVLIIACPCAMGLATPVSVMVATGRGAQLGILLRQGEALQRLQETRVVAFDKTGTLTQGTPRLIQTHRLGDWSEDHVLRLVAAAESRSEHPLARALTDAAKSVPETAQVSDVQALSGLGLRAQVQDNGQSYALLIGSARLLGDHGLDLSQVDAQIETAESAGHSIVLAAIDNRPAALFTIADTLRPEAQSLIAALHARGLKTAMITGDSERAARHIGDRLGVSHVVAGVLPDGKAREIERLRATYGPVAFVGDGINDAPALAAANVGLAMGTGTDVAIQSAQVVLAGARLGTVLTALDLSKRTMRNIRQNLVWAFGYNTLLIPVAAGALYPFTGLLLSPMLAAGAMALSSVFVVTNALRLHRFAAPETTPATRGPHPSKATLAHEH